MAPLKQFKPRPLYLASPLLLSCLLFFPVAFGASAPAKPPPGGSPPPAKAAQPTPKQQAILAYNDGNRLAISGKDEAAILKYLEAVRLDPTFMDAYNNLGVLYARGKLWPQAEEVYRRIALLRPAEVKPLLALAQLQRESGQPGAAQDTLRRAVSLFPTEITPRLALAQSFEAGGQLQQAEDQLNTAAVSHPKSLPALNPLASFYFRHKRYDEFYATMQRMWPLDSRNANLAYDLGVQAHQRKDWPKAVSYYRAAVRLNPRLGTAWQNLGSIYSTLKRPKDTADAFFHASKLNPGDFKARVALGISRYTSGDMAGAETSFRTAAKAQPDNVDVQSYLALALLRQKKYKEAEPIYVRLRAKGAKDAESLNNLAYIYSATGRPKQAIPLYEKAVAGQPSDENAHRSLATLYWQTGQTKKAATELETLTRLAPDDAAIRNGLIAAYQRSGQKEKAAALLEAQAVKDPKGYGPLADFYKSSQQPAKETEALEAWLKADPKNPKAADRLASAYLAQKKPQDAIRTLQTALAASPGNATLYNSLYQYYVSQGDKKTAEAKLREGLAKIPADSPMAAEFHTQLASLIPDTDTDAALKELDRAEAAAKDPQTKIEIGSRKAALMEKKQAGSGDKEYQRLVALYPDNFQLRFAWSMSLSRREKYLDAIAQLKAGFLRDPQTVSRNPFLPYGAFKDWSISAKQPQLGIATLKELLQKYPAQTQILPALSSALATEANRQNRPFSLKDPDLAYLAALAKKHPDASGMQTPVERYLYERGLDRAVQKKTAEAAEVYRELIRIAPKVPYYRARLGKMLETEGKKEDALAVYRRAQKELPEFPEFPAAIKRLTDPNPTPTAPAPANPASDGGAATTSPGTPAPTVPKP